MRRVAVIGVGTTKFGKHDRTAASSRRGSGGTPSATRTSPRRRSRLCTTAMSPAAKAKSSCTWARSRRRSSAYRPSRRPASRTRAPPATRPPPCGHGDRGGHLRCRHGGRRRARAEHPHRRGDPNISPIAPTPRGNRPSPDLPGVFALVARAHMDKHGTTEEQMAHVAVKNHRHGALNPKAQFRKEITVDMVLNSAYVADPLKLLDCCPFTDGGAAVVLAAEEVARQRPRAVWCSRVRRPPTRCLSTRSVISRGSWRPSVPRPPPTVRRERTPPTWMSSSCTTASPSPRSSLPRAWASSSRALAARPPRRAWTSLGGRIPVNPSGGLKAKGHPIGATGAAQIAEITTQLRGEAGARQVEGARTGLTHTLAATPPPCS